MRKHEPQQAVGRQHQDDPLAALLIIELPQPRKDQGRQEKSRNLVTHDLSYPKVLGAVKGGARHSARRLGYQRASA